MELCIKNLILENMSFAERIAIKYKRKLPNQIDLDDLKAAAYLGLTKAAKKFDFSKNVSFKNFAYFRILGEIKDFLRSQYWFKNCKKYSKIDIDVVMDHYIYNHSNNIDSLDSLQPFMKTNLIKEILSFYLNGFTMKEIGSKLSLTEARISQIICSLNNVRTAI